MLALALILIISFANVSSIIPESPLHKVLRFLPSAVPSGKCQHALYQYLYYLDRGGDWALKLYDASTKYPEGILVSNGYSLGHYDQCVQAQTETFVGKYCLVNVHYSKANSTTHMMRGNRFKLKRSEANFALCLPSVCTANVIEAALQQSTQLFSFLENYNIQVKLKENQCSTLQADVETASVLTLLSYLLLAAVGVYFLRSLKVSADEVDSSVRQCQWSGLSLSQNWRKLFSREHERMEDMIYCVHGLRVLALSIVIVGHRAEAIASSPLMNPDSLEKMFESPFNVLVLNGTIFVDTFFTITGFLITWKILKISQKGYKITSWQVFKHRFFRLTPSYAVAIFLQAFILEGLGSGPLWQMKVGKEARNCRQNWWTNLLYINNYWDPEHICIDPSWYLACDMQLLLLVPLVIQPLLRWGRNRLFPFLIALLSAFWIPFFITYYYRLDPTVIPDLETVGQTAFNQTNLLLYITSYCRAGPYLIGIAAALLLDRLQTNQHWPTKVTHPEYDFADSIIWVLNIVFWTRGWILAAATIFGSIFSGFPFFTKNKVNLVMTALYAASFRTVFAVGVAFIIIAGACGKAGIIGDFLSSQSLMPLSRISYSVYLTHTLWMQFSYSWVRSPLHTTDLFQACCILSDLVICSIIGMIFYLFVECPFSELCKYFQNKEIQKMLSTKEKQK